MSTDWVLGLGSKVCWPQETQRVFTVTAFRKGFGTVSAIDIYEISDEFGVTLSMSEETLRREFTPLE